MGGNDKGDDKGDGDDYYDDDDLGFFKLSLWWWWCCDGGKTLLSFKLRSVSIHSWYDRHSHELLEEQFRSVRHLNTKKLGAVSVATWIVAEEGHTLKIRLADKSTN